MNLEQKVDLIEGELGIMKGEIKQTLVDLREFIMKQGAPFPATGQPQVASTSPPKDEVEEASAGTPSVQQVTRSPDESGGGGISPADVQRMIEEARASGLQEARGQQVQQAPARAPDQVAPPPQVVHVEQVPQPVRQAAPPAQGAAQQPAQSLQVGRGPAEAAPRGVVQAGQAQAQAQRRQAAPEQVVRPIEAPPPIAREAAPYFEAGPVVGAEDFVDEAEGFPDVSALDANLLTSLMRWVGGIKRRLGSDQIEGFLEIYKITGHLPPTVERLIYYLAALDVLPDESSDQVFTMDDLMDSLLQLHAIVYGPGYALRGSPLNLEEQLSEVAEENG